MGKRRHKETENCFCHSSASLSQVKLPNLSTYLPISLSLSLSHKKKTRLLKISPCLTIHWAGRYKSTLWYSTSPLPLPSPSSSPSPRKKREKEREKAPVHDVEWERERAWATTIIPSLKVSLIPCRACVRCVPFALPPSLVHTYVQESKKPPLFF